MPPYRTVVQRRYAVSLPRAPVHSVTVLTLIPSGFITAPRYSSCTSATPPSSGQSTTTTKPTAPTTPVSDCLKVQVDEEGYEPKAQLTPTHSLDATDPVGPVPSDPASENRSAYFERRHHSKCPDVVTVWFASCGALPLPHPPDTFHSEASPEEYDLFVHTFGTETDMWIWVEGWKPVQQGFSTFINGRLRYLTVSKGKPSWVKKETYDRSLSKRKGKCDG
ncbi:hypothetical protein PC9H_008682 [Pleurotus ostreatus]|uniref:Uncharacterized protein n=2 Tax=Pleurotus TaxID=5320 RepID=A0A8H7DP94_PLEOS|nr:uncharacterized protein PC9H_008682 [Pleurotus ostreatus]KAF7426314.1 hypothetical protein PC9H_008682 [Pleurotus ostreatus]KAG9221737.1 hypothetical protein CCMSSC00406_0006680 [Pleurotus cornucopiae]KAJ8693816.1 hypothetical protein PTI98_008773 [Pleurotus ostreatus]